MKSIQIFNTIGELVVTLNPNNTTVEIDAQKLSKGIYFARISSDHKTTTLKLVRR